MHTVFPHDKHSCSNNGPPLLNKCPLLGHNFKLLLPSLPPPPSTFSITQQACCSCCLFIYNFLNFHQRGISTTEFSFFSLPDIFYLHLPAEFFYMCYLFFQCLFHHYANLISAPSLPSPPSNKPPPYQLKFKISPQTFTQGNMLFSYGSKKKKKILFLTRMAYPLDPFH